MNDPSIERCAARAVDRGGATHARVIDPSTVVTAPWVRLKCQFGCPGYGRSYRCPPDTPTPEQTQAILDGYQRAILFHLEAPSRPDGSRRERRHRLYDTLVTLEGELFKEGYYKAFVFLSGPCHLCRECGKLKGEPCQLGFRARPSMEACGIDVYRTARNSGFFIEPLREKSETQNIYCLMLVD
jgi:predicted metal-binding protein